MTSPDEKGSAGLGPNTEPFELIPAAVLVCDARGRLVYSNRRAARLWGREPQIDDVSAMAEVLRAGEALRDREVTVHRPDGSAVGVRAMVEPIRDASGELSGAIGIYEEIPVATQRVDEPRPEETRFAAIVAALPAAVYTVDLAGRLTLFNEAAVDLWGRRPVLGEESWSGSYQIFRPDGSPMPLDACPIAVALREGRSVRGEEIVIERPDGERRRVRPHPEPLFGASGEVVGAVNMLMDITGLKRAEERAREGEARFRAIFETTPECVKLIAPDGTLLEMNPAGLGMVEAERAEDVVGRCVYDLVVPAHRQRYREFNERVCRGEAGSLEFDMIGLGGTRRTLVTHAVPFPFADGRVLHQAVTRDVTDQRRSELERNLLAAIVESSDDAIVSKDLDGVITSWNKGAERLLGYTAAEAVGRHVSMLMPPEHIEDTAKILGSIRRGVRVDHYETRRRTKDGRIIDVSLTVSPLRDASGTIVGASKVGRDISDRRRSELERNLLAAIVESSDDAIVSKDLDGVITSWNKGAERLLGYTAAEAVGRHVSMLMPPEHIEDTAKILGSIRRGVRVDHYETRRRTKDGRIIDVSLTVSPLRDASGTIVGASKVGRDITESKRSVEAIRRSEELLRQMNARKDEFLAMLSHELRNPLSAISSAVQVARRSDLDEPLSWSTEIIERQVRHLSRLIDDLLDVSRITRGKIRLRREAVDIGPILGGAVESVRPLIEERRHELTVSFRPGALVVKADRVRLEQVVVNLLTNAAKYTDVGGRIFLAAERSAGEVVIRVRDTGVGMRPDRINGMFELFAQDDRALARSEGGLGIGLTIVKSLVEMHGGAVTATSGGPGLGSEFVVRLPAEATVTQEQGPSADAAGRRERVGRILIVDDNDDAAYGLARLLKVVGHEVRTARDGPEAIAIARDFRPDSVLLDIGLPGMDGYEVARRLREEDACRQSLIVAITGYGQESDRRRASEAGCDHHLVKPVDHDVLLDLICM